MSDYPSHPSESFKRLNPDIYGPTLARVPYPKRERDQRRQSEDRKLDARPPRLEFRVMLISIRRRKVDEFDNLRTGAKPLVDAIARDLGLPSDDDPRVEWAYGQTLTTGTEGTIVKVERL